MHNKLTSAFAAFLLATTLAVAAPQVTFAQSAPSVSMVTLQTMPGQNGQQMVVTPKGKVVPLPGAGVNSNVVQIYIGSQGGYWYVDKTGQTVDLTSAVQYMQSRMGQAGAAPVPQYAPAPVTVNNYESSGSSSSGSGSSAAGTAVAAGLGAAAGAAITNAAMEPNYGYYHGVPYGYPMYYGANNKPYYVDRGGNNVYVNNQNEVNRNVNASATQNNVSATNLQKQQDWYNNQARSNSSQFQNWKQSANSENPFVHPDAQGGVQNARQNAGEGEGRGGRFGRRGGGENGGADGGGRFAGGEAGGRFGNGEAAAGGRFGGGNAGGGRFGGRRGR